MRGHDRELGLHRAIHRRDFVNGTAMALGASLLPKWSWALDLDARAAAQEAGADYPPRRTGMRGSHAGSFELSHQLRDGGGPDLARADHTGETYDLVVVGGGLSGLAAAYYFVQNAGRSARVLVLDNHDDFGGHARRNEFAQGGRLVIGYGGSYAIDSPAPYSAAARALVDELGIDVSKWERAVDWSLYTRRGLVPGFFFDRESFGVDRLLRDPLSRRAAREAGDEDPWAGFLAQAPLSEAARRDLKRLVSEPRDPYPGLTSSEKKARLARTSYADYVTRLLGYDAGVLPVFQARPHGLYGVGVEAVPAQDAWGLGYPGFQGLGLEPGAGPGMNLDALPFDDSKPYFFHFPDGNATLARLLVRGLVPTAVAGRTAEDIVTAKLDYARLDAPGAPVRIRLGSTVVKVAHAGEPSSARHVDVTYVEAGKLRSVRGRRAILACWNQVIPHICVELPRPQKDALAYATKVPLVYTNVLLRDWTAFVKLGHHQVHAPNGYYSSLNLAHPVSVGDYRCPSSPDQPIVIHMGRAACRKGLSTHEQHVAGRLELLETSFETHEREIRAQLARLLAPGGFDPARDILAITVNRWPHGYAYQYNSLYDDFWLTNDEPPCVRARRPFGLIAIANSDAGAYAYVDSAFDQAFRAVQEVLPRRG